MKLHFWQFSPVQKLIFWPFLKWQKMEFGQKKISWNWFIWFHEFFFALDFYNFLAHCGMLEVDWYTSCNTKRYFKGDSNIKTMSHIAYGGKNAQRARKFKKVQAKKNSWNQINQFQRKKFHNHIPFFAISKMAKNQS